MISARQVLQPIAGNRHCYSEGAFLHSNQPIGARLVVLEAHRI